jgi:hypothetical protein
MLHQRKKALVNQAPSTHDPEPPSHGTHPVREVAPDSMLSAQQFFGIDRSVIHVQLTGIVHQRFEGRSQSNSMPS